MTGDICQKNKIDDVKFFASRYNPDRMGISEINLNRNEQNLNDKSISELSTEQVHDLFKIEKYNIILPDSWMKHDKTRLLVYVHEELKVKRIKLKDDESHIQSIVLEVGYGKSKTHIYNYYYREWKSCVTGLDNINSQMSDLNLLMNIWRRCSSLNKDLISTGDMNLDAKLWDEPGYRLENLANLVKDFLITENCHQIMNEYTHIRSVQGVLQQSCLDHITVNCINKIISPQVFGIGQSDHLGTYCI